MAKHDLIAERVSGVLYLVNGMSKLIPTGEPPRPRLAAPDADPDAHDGASEALRRLPKRATIFAALFALLVLFRVVGLLAARRPGAGRDEE